MILKEMADAVQRADGVIRGLLDFSAPKQLEVRREDLNAIIEQALKLVRGEMKGAFEIERELQPNLPPLELDAGKISQVFINLFTNALHAMGDGGILTVRTYAKQLTGVGANIVGQPLRILPRRADTSSSRRSTTPGAASPRTSWRKSSSPFSPPSRPAKGPASAFPS